MTSSKLKITIVALMGLGLFVGATQVRAQTQQPPTQQQGKNAGQWKKNHPRRAEVNRRLNRQNRRVQNGVKSGKLTPQQAQQIHQQDRSIRQQERQDAAANGGHITRQEQRQLNREENGVNREIKRDERGNQVTPAAAPAAPAAQ